MTPDQKRVLRETWRQVAPMDDAAAELFYRRLFRIDPTVRPLFATTDMTAQREKLMETLTAVVQGLDHFEALLPAIQDLGRRHVGYGTTDAHYDSVGQALLWTLEQALGEGWTPEVAAAWAEAYGTVAKIMRDAAREAPAAGISKQAIA